MFWGDKPNNKPTRNPSPVKPIDWISAAKLAFIAYHEPEKVEELIFKRNEFEPGFDLFDPKSIPTWDDGLVKNVLEDVDPNFKYITSSKTGTDVFMNVHKYLNTSKIGSISLIFTKI